MNNQHHSVMINMPPSHGQSFRIKAALNGINGLSATKFSLDDLVVITLKKHLGHYAIQQMKMIFENTPKKYYHDLLFNIPPIGKYKLWWRTNLISKVNYLPPSLTLSLSKITRNKIYI